MIALLVASMLPSVAVARDFPQRWNYVRPDLDGEEGLRGFLDLLGQSRAVGCTHILINDGRYLRRSDDPAYLDAVGRVRSLASDLGLDIVPAVYPFGYSGRYLNFDRNLFAGLPVRDMPFIVRDGRAIPDPSLTPDLSGLDSTGSGSIAVRPFTHYRVIFYTRDSVEARPSRVLAANSAHRRHMRGTPRIVPVSDLLLHDRPASGGFLFRITGTFNSLEADSITLRIQAGVPIHGLTVEPEGFRMVLRRDLTPLVVASDDGRTVYEEGRDFARVEDPVIASSDQPLDTDHPAPVLTLLPGSRIRSGQSIRASFFHAYRVLDEQDIITLEDPAVFPMMERDIDLVTKVWQPKGYFMSYDEIRIGGWERPDRPTGELLADHVRKGVDIIRRRAPDARVYVWSDMFTPHHNARPFAGRNEYYYLANGNWEGAGEGLPADVIVMNWFARDRAAVQYFADRGNPQVLCGYYDPRDEAGLRRNIHRWMTVSDGVAGVIGLMYTTWENNYGDLDAFFSLTASYETWKATVPSAPTDDD